MGDRPGWGTVLLAVILVGLAVGVVGFLTERSLAAAAVQAVILAALVWPILARRRTDGPGSRSGVAPRPRRRRPGPDA